MYVKTLWTLRHLLSGNDLSGLIFQTATEKLAKLFSIDPSWQRLDSVAENCVLGGILTFYEAIIYDTSDLMLLTLQALRRLQYRNDNFKYEIIMRGSIA